MNATRMGLLVGVVTGLTTLGVGVVRAEIAVLPPPQAAPAAADLAACAKGKGDVCLKIGVAYMNGDQVAKDPVKAFDYYSKACKAKSAEGCGFAGTLLITGEGTTANATAGYKLRDKACTGKHAESCNDLGSAWAEGKDGAGKVDFKKAKAFYEKACKLKDGTGCFNVGNTYRLGEGVKVDMQKAMSNFQVSCDLGEPKGCTELAIVYYEGTAVPKDVDKAVALLAKGCKLGSDVACKNHQALSKAQP